MGSTDAAHPYWCSVELQATHSPQAHPQATPPLPPSPSRQERSPHFCSKLLAVATRVHLAITVDARLIGSLMYQLSTGGANGIRVA